MRDIKLFNYNCSYDNEKCAVISDISIEPIHNFSVYPSFKNLLMSIISKKEDPDIPVIIDFSCATVNSLFEIVILLDKFLTDVIGNYTINFKKSLYHNIEVKFINLFEGQYLNFLFDFTNAAFSNKRIKSLLQSLANYNKSGFFENSNIKQLSRKLISEYFKVDNIGEAFAFTSDINNLVGNMYEILGIPYEMVNIAHNILCIPECANQHVVNFLRKSQVVEIVTMQEHATKLCFTALLNYFNYLKLLIKSQQPSNIESFNIFPNVLLKYLRKLPLEYRASLLILYLSDLNTESEYASTKGKVYTIFENNFFPCGIENFIVSNEDFVDYITFIILTLYSYHYVELKLDETIWQNKLFVSFTNSKIISSDTKHLVTVAISKGGNIFERFIYPLYKAVFPANSAESRSSVTTAININYYDDKRLIIDSIEQLSTVYLNQRIEPNTFIYDEIISNFNYQDFISNRSLILNISDILKLSSYFEGEELVKKYTFNNLIATPYSLGPLNFLRPTEYYGDTLSIIRNRISELSDDQKFRVFLVFIYQIYSRNKIELWDCIIAQIILSKMSFESISEQINEFVNITIGNNTSTKIKTFLYCILDFLNRINKKTNVSYLLSMSSETLDEFTEFVNALILYVNSVYIEYKEDVNPFDIYSLSYNELGKLLTFDHVELQFADQKYISIASSTLRNCYTFKNQLERLSHVIFPIKD